MTKEVTKPPFELTDIQDAKIIVKAGDKHYSFLPKDKDNKWHCQQVRVAMILAIIEDDNHVIITTPLEEVENKLLDLGKPKIYPNTEFPKRQTDLKGNEEEHSVDVFTRDEYGFSNVGYYNFDTGIWMFHTDTFIDLYEGDQLMNFVWMYRPEALSVK